MDIFLTRTHSLHFRRPLWTAQSHVEHFYHGSWLDALWWT